MQRPFLKSLRPSSALCAALALAPACGDDGSATTSGASESASQSASATATATATASTTAGGSTDPSASGSASESATGSTSSPSTTAGTTTGAPTTSGPTTGPETTGGPTTDPTTTGGTTTGGVDAPVRFVVLGDTGEGNEDQYSVAQAIVEVCAERGCDFAMLTGDNFYDSGVSGVDDPQWQSKFEMPYEDFTFPVYAVLGNHDYGGGGIGVDFNTNKPDYQVEYTQKSELWTMPAKFYEFSLENVDFWGLDTNEVMTDPLNGDSDPQKSWLQAGVAASDATWKIAFGHHPYISNGDHGNAGNYENLEAIPFPFVTGTNVKKFMDEAVCGKIDVYVSGHDHNLQWLQPKCGTEFIVSGAGSKAEELPGSNPVRFEIPAMEGFLWVEIVGDTFTGAIYDKTGAELFTHSFSK